VKFQPVGLGDVQLRQLRGKSIRLVQVICDKRTGDSTWELEEDVRKSYPNLFSGKSQIFGSKIFVVRENLIPLSEFPKNRSLTSLLLTFSTSLQPATSQHLFSAVTTSY